MKKHEKEYIKIKLQEIKTHSMRLYEPYGGNPFVLNVVAEIKKRVNEINDVLKEMGERK